MSSPPVPKEAIACEFLSRSIELFLRGDSYFSAIHLAAAAEELLSVILRELPQDTDGPGEPPFDQMKDAVVRLAKPATQREAEAIEAWMHSRMTGAKNSIKHMRGLRDAGVNFEAKEEAQEVIDRTISAYIQLANRAWLPAVSGISEFDAICREERAQ